MATQKIEQSLCTFHAFPSNFQKLFCNQDCLFFGSKSMLTKHFLAFDKLLFLVLKRGFLTRDFFLLRFHGFPFINFLSYAAKRFSLASMMVVCESLYLSKNTESYGGI